MFQWDKANLRINEPSIGPQTQTDKEPAKKTLGKMKKSKRVGHLV